MKNEEKKMKRLEKKAEKQARKQRFAEAVQTPEETAQTAETSVQQTDTEKKQRRLPKLPLPKRAKDRTPREKGEKTQRVRSWAAAHKTGVKRAAIGAIAVVLVSNVILTSVFVAYSVRTRREEENDYYSNFWEIDDLRTQMQQSADTIEENMDQWKTGESIYSGSIGDNLTWEIDPETAELRISGEGDMDESFNESRRPSFGMLYAGFVRTIVVSSGVTSIAPYAFQGFTSLESVELGADTATIGECAFSDCTELSEVTTRAGLKEIERNAFYGCGSLHELLLPEGFESCSVVNTECSGIRFKAAEGGKYSSDTNGCLYRDDGKTLVSCPVGTDYDYQGDPKSWSVPKGVTAVADECFIGNHLKCLTIPGTVETLDLAAFDKCVMRELTLKKGVKELVGTPGNEVYFNKVVLPESMETVDEDLFDVQICEMDVSAKQRALCIGENGLVYSADRKELLFVPYSEDRETLRIADGTERIHDNTVNDLYGIKSIVLPESLKVIGDGNFNSIYMEQGTTFKLPAHLTYIGDDCLRYGTISRITMPSSVKHIGSNFLFETDDSRYDEDSDIYTEKMTKVEFGGTKNQWNALFGEEKPEYFKLAFAD